MTQTATESALGGGARATPPPKRHPVKPPMSWQIAGSVWTVLSIMLLSFVAEMTLIGPVREARNQDIAYDQLRTELALATAPTGQLDYNGDLVKPGAPIALITIADIGLHAVVLEGTTAGVLQNGPGHRRDSPMPGQPGTVVIMGRQATYGGPFRHLGELKPGAEIALTTAQGSHLYKVTGQRLAGDTQSVVDPDDARLTLVTGAGQPFVPSDVLRVDAKLVSKVRPAPARPLGAEDLANNEQAMTGDTTVLLPLLLWSQLLLLIAVILVWVRTVWGRWQCWIVAVPTVGAVGLQVAHLTAQLVPNLL